MIGFLIIILPLLLLGGAIVWLLGLRSASQTPEMDTAATAGAVRPASFHAAEPGPISGPVSAPGRKRRKNGEPRNILIVDDQPAIRMLLAEVFHKAGFTVYEAGNGREAIELFKRSPTEFLLLDLKMPDMDGLEALREIRTLCLEVNTVMISAYSDPEKLEEARQLGVQRIFTKPFDMEKLRDYVLRQVEAS